MNECTHKSTHLTSESNLSDMVLGLYREALITMMEIPTCSRNFAPKDLQLMALSFYALFVPVVFIVCSQNPQYCYSPSNVDLFIICPII